MMLDLDVPAAALNGTNSMPPADPNARLTLLHALTTDLTPTTQRLLSSLSPTNGANGTADSVLLTTPTVEQSPAAYLGPSPPNTDTTPHRYVSLVFEQPASGLQIEAGAFDDIQARIGFDVQAFMQENGLSEPLAGNFFVVDGMNPESGAGFNGSATGTGGIGGPTGQPRLFEGTAAATEAALGLAAGFAMMVGLVV